MPRTSASYWVLAVLVVGLIGIVIWQGLRTVEFNERIDAMLEKPGMWVLDERAATAQQQQPANPGGGEDAITAGEPFRSASEVRARLEVLFGDDLERFALGPLAGERLAAMPYAPRLDVAESEAAFHVAIDLPGTTLQAIEVKADPGGDIAVRGKRTVERPAEGAEALRNERRTGPFERVVSLPGAIDAEGIETRYEAGVLRITAPKQASAKEQGEGG